MCSPWSLAHSMYPSSLLVWANSSNTSIVGTVAMVGCGSRTILLAHTKHSSSEGPVSCPVNPTWGILPFHCISFARTLLWPWCILSSLSCSFSSLLKLSWTQILSSSFFFYASPIWMSSSDLINTLLAGIDKIMACDKTKDKTLWHATLPRKSNLDDWVQWLICLVPVILCMPLWLDYNNISNYVFIITTEVSIFHVGICIT